MKNWLNKRRLLRIDVLNAEYAEIMKQCNRTQSQNYSQGLRLIKIVRDITKLKGKCNLMNTKKKK